MPRATRVPNFERCSRCAGFESGWSVCAMCQSWKEPRASRSIFRRLPVVASITRSVSRAPESRICCWTQPSSPPESVFLAVHINGNDRGPFAPRVVPAAGDLQHSAHRGDCVHSLIRAHEFERRDGVTPVSVANQVAALILAARRFQLSACPCYVGKHAAADQNSIVRERTFRGRTIIARRLFSKAAEP